MGSEPRNILKIFLNFTDFEAHYSYEIYSYKKKSVFPLYQGNLLETVITLFFFYENI